jgi:hypothetical protein
MQYNEAVINLIQRTNRDCGIIRSAPLYAKYPDAVDLGQLPMALSYPAQGRTQVQIGVSDARRRYIIEVFVAPAGSPGTREQRLKTARLLDAFLEHWSGLADGEDSDVLDYGEESGLNVFVDWSQQIEDSGPSSDLKFFGTGQSDDYYHGFQILVPMHIRWGTIA